MGRQIKALEHVEDTRVTGVGAEGGAVVASIEAQIIIGDDRGVCPW